MNAISRFRKKYNKYCAEKRMVRENPTVRFGRRVGIGNVRFEGFNSVGMGAQMRGWIEVGRYSTIGRNAVIVGRDDTVSVTIGRYCQLAPRVAIYTYNHPIDTVTTFVGEELFGGAFKESFVNEPVRIGHDVWIGHGAIVLPGVKIGTGCIIGAGAVVTKDIAPYAIAAGNPAKVIRPRFDDEVAQALLKWEWWNLTAEQLEPHRRLFELSLVRDRDIFLQELRRISG
jgi:acetyltransferase-like isoleucine patch superfamily enzyme